MSEILFRTHLATFYEDGTIVDTLGGYELSWLVRDGRVYYMVDKEVRQVAGGITQDAYQAYLAKLIVEDL